MTLPEERFPHSGPVTMTEDEACTMLEKEWHRGYEQGKRASFTVQDILDLGRVARCVAEAYTPEGAEHWWTHRNRYLDDCSPAEVVLRGDVAKVRRVTEPLLEGTHG